MVSKICTYGGCKRVATTGARCDRHQRETAQRKTYEHNRIGRLGNIYNSQRWKALRDRKVKMAPICELCKTVGEIRPTDEVDHWLEIIDFRPFAFDIDNLVGLCSTCHRQKTALYKAHRGNKRRLAWVLRETHPTGLAKHLREALIDFSEIE